MYSQSHGRSTAAIHSLPLPWFGPVVSSITVTWRTSVVSPWRAGTETRIGVIGARRCLLARFGAALAFGPAESSTRSSAPMGSWSCDTAAAGGGLRLVRLLELHLPPEQVDDARFLEVPLDCTFAPHDLEQPVVVHLHTHEVLQLPLHLEGGDGHTVSFHASLFRHRAAGYHESPLEAHRPESGRSRLPPARRRLRTVAGAALAIRVHPGCVPRPRGGTGLDSDGLPSICTHPFPHTAAIASRAEAG